MEPTAPPPDPRLAVRLRRRIAEEGPLPFSAFVDAALYDPEAGFYATGGVAGRRGDFLTSPEVGPLFGAVVARALDRWWDELGRPDPFVVVEGGAGPGTLARTVARAAPACSAALVHVLVERSAAQRARHRDQLPAHAGEPGAEALARFVAEPRARRGPVVVSAADVPAVPGAGVVLANELLDNLPFDVVRRTSTGAVEELRVGEGPGGGLDLVVVTADADPAATAVALTGVPVGCWVPRQVEAARWVRSALAAVGRGRVVVLDYTVTDAELGAATGTDWLRTYRGHERGGHPADEPGGQDITADLAVDQLLRAVPGATVSTQADFLRRHGIDELVDEGRRVWAERAHLGDLEAVRGRSRVREADALLDPSGLGAFGVVEWVVGDPGGGRDR